MAKALRRAAVFCTMLLLAVAALSCGKESGMPPNAGNVSAITTTQPSSPAPASPAEPAVDPTASLAPANGYSAGEKPFSGLKAEDIERIRMIEYLDSQPPEYSDPYKDVSGLEDMRTLVGVLNRVVIQQKIDIYDMPIGATGYQFFVNMKDGKQLSIYLYGDHTLSRPGGSIYEISKIPDLDAVFHALSGKALLMPDNTNAPK